MTVHQAVSCRGGAVVRWVGRVGVALLGASLIVPAALAQEIESAPIRYSTAPLKNPVEEFRQKLIDGKAALEYEPEHGYLKSLLKAFDIPESSQVLVFSKTSLQRERISPKTPRAIYYNDEVLIGFCLRGQVIEISTVDDNIGTAFYSVHQAPPSGDEDDEEDGGVPMRQTESCLLCHSSSANQGFPGHLVRSLSVDRQGNPLLASGSFRTDHTSPIEERWGGWYVTGTSGKQKHMGNVISKGSRAPTGDAKFAGTNMLDLTDKFTTSFYLSPHSDIVSLMVLEHQVGMLNRLSRAQTETKMALHYEKELNKGLGLPENEPSESARSRIKNVGEAVVQYMLMGDEIELTDPIKGTSTFTEDFAARGPKDSKGRSLRDLDLQTRLFKYPCSYLIYSRAFNDLPEEVKSYVYQRLWELLNDKGSKKDDRHLAAADRQAILEILRETKPDLPDYWKETQ